MSNCSNRRCAQPNPGSEGRCLTCGSLLVGKLVRGRYLVKEMVSRGGFGATYLIEDQDCFDELRILKELRPASNEDNDGNPEVRKETAERLFKREAETLLNLNNTGIPKLFAFFVQDNFSYLLQEYIPGHTLAEAVTERGENLCEEEARHLLHEIASILNYLHHQNPPIVHRDIKPQNLMRHTDGRLLLIDFGAVCRAANQNTSSQTLIGSPGYAPPEQIMGQPMPQSDLYAAGVTTVRLLTGIHPTQLTNKRTQRIEWEKHVNVTTQFRDLLNELLIRDPLRRLSSAQELLRWLKDLELVPPMPRHLAKPVQQPVIETATSTALGDAVGQFEVQPSTNSRISVPGIITALNNLPEVIKGSLATTPIPALLFRSYYKGLSGMLKCSQNGVSQHIFFDQGTIVFASSSRREERLSEYLLRQGRITQQDFDRATRCVDETGHRMGAVLLQLGIISIDELSPLVVEHVSHLVYSIFNWTDGEYEFTPGQPPTEAIKMPFSTADIIFQGIRQLDNMELIKQWLGNFLRPLRTTVDPLLLYQTVTLYPREAFIVSRIDSSMSIEELLSFGGLPEDETLRTVCGLLAIGMLEPVDNSIPEQQPSTPIGNVLSQPDPLPQDFDFSTAAAFCYEVESKLHSIDNSDAFGVLEINRQASDQEVTEAYKNLARKFHPDRHSQLLNYNISLRADLDRIFKTIASAYEMLKNRERRSTGSRLPKLKIETINEYTATSYPPKQSEPPTRAKNSTPALSSELPTSARDWFLRGQAYYQAGQYESATISYENAIKLVPSEASYHFHLARALAHIVGCFQEAETEFYRALELAPNEADYYAEFGLFYLRVNLPDRAERMFDFCLKIAPSNPIALRSQRSR